jgi:hypothetical protein
MIYFFSLALVSKSFFSEGAFFSSIIPFSLTIDVERVEITVRVREVIMNKIAITVVILVNIFPLRDPKAVWLLPPPNTEAKSVSFPAWSNTIAINNIQAKT